MELNMNMNTMNIDGAHINASTANGPEFGDADSSYLRRRIEALEVEKRGLRRQLDTTRRAMKVAVAGTATEGDGEGKGALDVLSRLDGQLLILAQIENTLENELEAVKGTYEEASSLRVQTERWSTALSELQTQHQARVSELENGVLARDELIGDLKTQLEGVGELRSRCERSERAMKDKDAQNVKLVQLVKDMEKNRHLLMRELQSAEEAKMVLEGERNALAHRVHALQVALRGASSSSDSKSESK